MRTVKDVKPVPGLCYNFYTTFYVTIINLFPEKNLHLFSRYIIKSSSFERDMNS